MEHIAQRLLEKNEALHKAITEANTSKQYKAIEPFITGRLLAKIGKAEGSFIKKRDLIWAIIDEFNGEGTEELDY